MNDLLTLPATNADVLSGAINPALEYLPPKMRSDEARVMQLAIGRQESGFRTRRQVGGTAHGFPQFERNGVLAVMHNNRSADYVYRLCRDLDILYGSTSLYESLLTNDILGMALARLTLWCDPRSLPAIGDIDGAWDTYTACWAPGKPDRERWTDAYSRAVETIKGPAA